MTTKPIVHYDSSEPVLIVPLGEAWVAKLHALDHPALGTGVVRTSRLVAFDPLLGRIETLNTIYVPEESQA